MPLKGEVWQGNGICFDWLIYNVRHTVVILLALSSQSVAMGQEPTSKESKAVRELFQILSQKDALTKTTISHGRLPNFELFDKTSLLPVIKKLKLIADTRIPPKTSSATRVKLQLAAKFDIHRTIAEISECFAAERYIPHRFGPGSNMEIFGSGSLFEKVMRQQGLLAN